MPLEVLQRDSSFNGARKQGHFFILKTQGHRAVRTLVALIGWELRFFVGREMLQTQVCRTQDEVLTTGEQWKAAMIEKGW